MKPNPALRDADSKRRPAFFWYRHLGALASTRQANRPYGTRWRSTGLNFWGSPKIEGCMATTDTRIPVRLAGIPTREIVQTIGQAADQAKRPDVLAKLYAARNVEEALRAVSDDVRFIWEREPPAEKERAT